MSNRQVAMVIDLNKCIGCQTCTVACKTSWTSGEGQEGMWWNCWIDGLTGHIQDTLV